MTKEEKLALMDEVVQDLSRASEEMQFAFWTGYKHAAARVLILGQDELAKTLLESIPAIYRKRN